MYPVSLGYEEAKKRINKLSKNGHYAEALLTSVFTIEKTLRRTLKQLIVSTGFPSRLADKYVKGTGGITRISQNWIYFDPEHRSLNEIISNSNWQIIKHASKMRNNLVHGTRVYDVEKCEKEVRKIVALLDDLTARFEEEYEFNGWAKFSIRRKSTLHADPKVKVVIR